ncbi:MAG: hydantoinase B/oxoprolinase family protein [Actinobacteria bacterium]|nr:hydantoinase B/oxoprolinase family protein [Actinomycetota bacterium]
MTAAEQNISWDGKDFPYKPPATIEPPPGLRLHTERSGEELDPITFEVLSTKLWNINEEHADTIHRVSGSPVVVDNYDFNTSITTESGEAFLFSPYIQYFGGAAELTVKYTLENRAANGGIVPGDVFILNDCLIAGSHQMDVGIYAPVFAGEELFCWVYNACHVRDIGGVSPGSFCIQAENIYWDPPMLRAVKLADADGIRADIEDTLLRFSRTPHLLALELRSQLAGISRAKARIEELLEAYPPAVVKATMYKLIEDTEAAVGERLRQVPDGTWTDVVYCGGAFPGDRGVHRTVVTMAKRGDRLFFDNHGTDPQVAAFNCGYGQWRSAIACALTHMLAFDHKLCTAGVVRRADFETTLGTISTVDRDGAFSALHAQILTIFQAEKVIGKMLYPDPEQRPHLIATSSLSTASWITHAGVDQWGQPFATVTLDQTGGGLGASATRDGIDQGGTTFWPKSEIPDCEAWERYFPVLYLYRRSAQNCGHGKYRGGNGVAFALAGHGTEEQTYSTVSVTSSTPTAAGVCGGFHGVHGLFYGVEGCDLDGEFAAGRVPAGPAEIRALDGDGATLAAKSPNRRLLRGDVIDQILCGGGGFGDPLERDPAAVARDVADGQVGREVGERVYGVCLEGDGRADLAATAARREGMREARLARATAPTPFAAPEGERRPVLELADQLRLEQVDDRYVVCCRRCATVLGPAEDNYKEHAAHYDGELTEIDPVMFVNPAEELDADVVYRSFLCPGCGVLLENELTLRDAPPLHDIRLDLDSVARREWARSDDTEPVVAAAARVG